MINNEEEKKGEIIVSPENKKSELEKSLKIGAVIGVILAIGFLIVYKTSINKDFEFWKLILISVGIVAVAFFVYSFFNIQRKFKELSEKNKEKGNIPDPVSEEVRLDFLHNKALKNRRFFNEVKEVLDETCYTVGGNLIYHYKVRALYGSSKVAWNIFYNANYPDRYSIKPEVSKYEILKIVNSMSSNPSPPEEIKKTEIWNPFTQTYQKTEERKPSKSKKDKDKKEDSEE